MTEKAHSFNSSEMELFMKDGREIIIEELEEKIARCMREVCVYTYREEPD